MISMISLIDMTMSVVIKPVKKPPRLEETNHLSLGAQRTLEALQEKYNYNRLVQSLRSPKRYDSSNYYKHIYNHTFKKKVESQSETEMTFGVKTSSTPQCQWQNKNFGYTSHDRGKDFGRTESNVEGEKNIANGLNEMMTHCHRPTQQNEFSGMFQAFKKSSFIGLEIEDGPPENSPRRQQEHCIQVEQESPFLNSRHDQIIDLVCSPEQSPCNLHEFFIEDSTTKGEKILNKWKKKFGSISNLVNSQQCKKSNGRSKSDSHHHHQSAFNRNLKSDLDMWSEDCWSQIDVSKELISSSPSPHSFTNQNLIEHNNIAFCSESVDEISNSMEQECTTGPFPSSAEISGNQVFYEISAVPVNLINETKNVKNLSNREDDKAYNSEMLIEADGVSAVTFSPEMNVEKSFQLPNVPRELISDKNVKAISIEEDSDINIRNVHPKSRKAHACAPQSGAKSCDGRSSSPGTTEDPLCASKNEKIKQKSTGRKREKDSAVQKVVKKLKSGFKPPSMQNSMLCVLQKICRKTLENSAPQALVNKPTKIERTKYINSACKAEGSKVSTSESLKEACSELPDIVDFFIMTSEKQHEVISEIKSTRQLSLTMIFSSGKALVNNFNSATDVAKASASSLMILTTDFKCYQFMLDSKTVATVREILLHIFCNKDCEAVVVNSKEFLSCAYRTMYFDTNQVIHCERLEDPVLASWLLNPDKPPSSFSMMCQTARFRFTGVETDWLHCLCFTKKLMSSLKKRLEGDNLYTLYKNIEIRLVPILSCMENQGLRVDIGLIRHFADILKNKLHKLEESAFKEVGYKFSINSHPQLRQVLYEELKLDEKLPSKSKIGKTSVSNLKSTCESSLLLLAGFHPLPSIILEYRTLQKLKSTYMDGMLSCVTNNSLSTHWDQTSAATGRLTSYQPNIQNVPKTVVVVEDYLPSSILGSAPKSSAQIYARKPFICHEEFVFLAADFQQIELRLLAHLSNDKALLSMFWNPASIDIFFILTAEWKNITVESVSNEDREATKRIVYSVMYGVGKEKLAEYLKVKPIEAKEIMNKFLARFPAIDSFTKECCSYARENGFTKTICGRRRYFPYINSPSPALRAQAQRQAVNFCVQGSAADICKLAMLEVESSLSQHPELKCRLLLQIHDELLWEVAEDQLYEVKGIIENVMENAKMLCNNFCSLQVPLAVSFSQGKSWAHLNPLNSSGANDTGSKYSQD